VARGGQYDRAFSSNGMACKLSSMRMVVVGCGVMVLYVIQSMISLYRVLFSLVCSCGMCIEMAR
jgi:hypothetical protein